MSANRKLAPDDLYRLKACGLPARLHECDAKGWSRSEARTLREWSKLDLTSDMDLIWLMYMLDWETGVLALAALLDAALPKHADHRSKAVAPMLRSLRLPQTAESMLSVDRVTAEAQDAISDAEIALDFGRGWGRLNDADVRDLQAMARIATGAYAAAQTWSAWLLKVPPGEMPDTLFSAAEAAARAVGLLTQDMPPEKNFTEILLGVWEKEEGVT